MYFWPLEVRKISKSDTTLLDLLCVCVFTNTVCVYVCSWFSQWRTSSHQSTCGALQMMMSQTASHCTLTPKPGSILLHSLLTGSASCQILCGCSLTPCTRTVCRTFDIKDPKVGLVLVYLSFFSFPFAVSICNKNTYYPKEQLKPLFYLKICYI